MSSMRWIAASVFLLACVSHLNSLGGDFHYDDQHSLVENPHVRDPGAIVAYFSDPATFSGEAAMAMYRPLVVLSYALTYALAGYSPWPYLLFNMLVHALVAMLVTLLVADRTGQVVLGWWTGALFAVHPINAQVVNYISSRSESLAIMGVLAAVYWLGRGARGWGVAAYVLALMSKSVAVVGWPLLLLWDRGRSVRAHWWPLAATTALYVAVIIANQFLIRSLAQDVRSYGVQLYTQTKAFAYYLYLLSMPVRLSVEHPLVESHAPGEAAVLAAGLLLASLVYLAVKNRSNAAAVGLGMALLGLAIPFFVPLNVLVNEHRTYLACFGLLFAITGSLRAGRSALAWAGAIALCALVVLGWQRNAVWEDEYTLWSAAARQVPNAFRVQSNLGLALYERGELAAAHQALSRALELNPRYARSWSNMGLVSEGLGHYGAAESAYKTALDLRPDLAGLRANLGRLYLGNGRYGEAIAALEQALALDPRSAAARTNLGLAHQRAGRLDLAVAAYRRALATGGASGELYNNLGLAYQDLGRLDEAEAALAKAVAMSAGDADAAINLKVLQLRRAGLESVALFEEMTGAFPQRAALWRSLASEYAARGRLDAAIAACRRVIALDPTDQQARANLDALLQKQRGQEVISD